MDGWNMASWGPGGWVVTGVVAVAFWAAVALGVAALVRAVRRPTEPPASPAADPAREILRDRLARGEVGVEEYASRLEALSRGER